MYILFPGIDDLQMQAECARGYCNPIVNNGLQEGDRATFDKGVARCTSPNELLTDHMHDDHSRM